MVRIQRENFFCEMLPQGKKYCIFFEEIAEMILKMYIIAIRNIFKTTISA
jgi:hypothetical protein